MVNEDGLLTHFADDHPRTSGCERLASSTLVVVIEILVLIMLCCPKKFVGYEYVLIRECDNISCE